MKGALATPLASGAGAVPVQPTVTVPAPAPYWATLRTETQLWPTVTL